MVAFQLPKYFTVLSFLLGLYQIISEAVWYGGYLSQESFIAWQAVAFDGTLRGWHDSADRSGAGGGSTPRPLRSTFIVCAR